MSEKALLAARVVLRIGVAVVVVIVAVIGLGVLLRVLNANPEAGFTDWAYGNQDVFMPPFEDVFDPVELGEDGNIVDLSGLLAMAVYACLLIPLGLALGWVRRSRLALAARREEEAEAARQARIFGGAETGAGDG
ncbi:MAG: hypothetical protein U5K30_00460 [Acidimicrobiales bacterium]|nr:hypothetical protein [Acidimicrobiales bacterium]